MTRWTPLWWPAIVGPLAAVAFALLRVNPVGAQMTVPWVLWPALAPGGSHHITYYLCDPLGPPLEWSVGVENWDTAMGSLVDFDPVVSCQSYAAPVGLRWEDAGNQCPPDPPGKLVLGCWQKTEYYQPTGSSEITLHKAVVLFRYANMMEDPRITMAGRIAAAAHEWGHNMSMSDIANNDQCSAHSVMGYLNYDNQSCQTGPSTNDWQQVRDAYDLLGPDDADGDAFTDAVELWVGTHRWDRCPDNTSDNAWPLDMNNDRHITVVGDVMKFAGKIGRTCAN